MNTTSWTIPTHAASDFNSACVPPFQLATPLDFQNHIPKGNLVLLRTLLCTNVCVFLDICTLFSGARGYFLRALGCGARRGPACTPRCKFGSRAGSVARALGIQSREIWQAITGLLSAELEPSKRMKTHMSAVLLHCCIILQLCGSHGTTAVAHQVCVTTTMWLWALHMRVCSVCAMIRARVSRVRTGLVFACWNPTFQPFVFLCSACCRCCCQIMSRLYNTVLQALKLHTLWQPRCNSSRTASLCDH